MQSSLPTRSDDCYEGAPTELEVFVTFNEKLTETTSNLLFLGLDVLGTFPVPPSLVNTTEDLLPDTILTNFDSNIIFIISPDISQNSTALQIFVNAFVVSYNEGNALSQDVCDPFNRIAISGKTLAAGFALDVTGHSSFWAIPKPTNSYVLAPKQAAMDRGGR